MTDERDDDLGLRDWAVPPPPDDLADRIVARVGGTGIHVAPAREPAPDAPARRWPRRAAIAGAIVAAAAATWIVVGARDRRAGPSGVAAEGALTAAADSVVPIGAGTVAEVDADARLAWRAGAPRPGDVAVTQSRGAVTYRHHAGVLAIDAGTARVETAGGIVRVEVPMQKHVRTGVISAAAAAAVVVAVYEGRAALSTPQGKVELRAGDVGVAAPGRAPTVVADEPAEPVARVTDRPRRMASAEERTALLDRIAAARARREARAGHGATAVGGAAGGGGGTMAAPPADPPVDPEAIRDSVREVIPLLAECFDMAPEALRKQGGRMVADLTVAGEPEVGTVIEDATFDDSDPNLLADADFTECVRETFLSVEMPPVEAGGRVRIRYPIGFSDEPPAVPPDKAPAPPPAGDGDTLKNPFEPGKQAAPRRGRDDAATMNPFADPGDPNPKRDRLPPDDDGDIKNPFQPTPADLIDQANAAARAGDYGKALVLAEQALGLDRDHQQALTTAAIAACNLKDIARARRYTGRLAGQRRGMVEQVCKRNGIELGE